MNLQRTKSYSVGIIQTKIEFYIEEDKPELMEIMEEWEIVGLAIQKAEIAMNMMNELMESGYKEYEAWEIVSKEVVYF